MTDKEFLQAFLNYVRSKWYGYDGPYYEDKSLERVQSIIDNMPDKEKLLEETLKRVDKICQERNSNTKFVEGTAYKVDELLFSPSLKASNV